MSYPSYQDGYYGTPVFLGRSPLRYPFFDYGDTVTAFYTATYQVASCRFVPTPRGTEDPDMPGFYLLQESDPDALTEELSAFTRTYCNVPSSHVRPWSTSYSRPAVPGTGQFRNYGTEAEGNAGLFYQPDTTMDRFKAYSRRAILLDQGVANNPTGGTYTLDFIGSTTAAINYNAVAATVKTALDGLASVTGYGGLATLTGLYNDPAGFLATFNNFAAATINPVGLTYAEASVQTGVVTSNNGWTQQLSLQLALTTDPRANFGGSVDSSGLTGYTMTSESITDERAAGFPHYAQQRVQLNSSTFISGGTFTITIFGQTTAPIAYNASHATVTAALNALSNVVAHGGATVTPWPGDSSYGQIYIQFFSSSVIRFMVSFGLPPFTGGTYDVTLFGQTASIAYNASLPAVQSALNALTNVASRGGVVVTGIGLSSDGTTISYTLTFSAAALTGISGMTPAPSAVTVGIVGGTNGRQQTIKLTASQTARLLTFNTAHGFTAGKPVYLMMGTRYFDRTDWAYISPTQISVNPSTAPWSTNTPITEGGQFQGDYSPGPAGHRGKVEAALYWPGITPGIASFDDIPQEAPPVSEGRYLDAIVQGVEYLPYSAGSLDYWRGPVLMRETTFLKPYRR